MFVVLASVIVLSSSSPKADAAVPVPSGTQIHLTNTQVLDAEPSNVKVTFFGCQNFYYNEEWLNITPDSLYFNDVEVSLFGRKNDSILARSLDSIDVAITIPPKYYICSIISVSL